MGQRFGCLSKSLYEPDLVLTQGGNVFFFGRRNEQPFHLPESRFQPTTIFEDVILVSRRVTEKFAVFF